MIRLIFVCFISGWVAPMYAGEQPTTCLLIMEPEQAPVPRFLSKSLNRQKNLAVFYEATPADLKHCFLNGANKIILYSHTIPWLSAEGKSSRLGFFLKLTEIEKKFYFDKWVLSETALLGKTREQLTDCEKNIGCNSFKKRRLISEILAMETRLIKLKRRGLENFQYGPIQPVLDIAFRQIISGLEAAPPSSPISMYLMTCDPDGVVQAYPSLKELLHRFPIQLRTNRPSKFWSFMNSQIASVFDYDLLKTWLRD